MDDLKYLEMSEKTCPDLGSEINNIMHMTIGISTEAGELLDAVKKHFAYGKPLDVVNMGEEIGDIFWYVYNLCRMLNLDPDQIRSMNIRKLQARYPNKFNQYDALNRNLDREREILEGKE